MIDVVAISREHRDHEQRTEPIESVDPLIEIVDEEQRHLGLAVPFPFDCQHGGVCFVNEIDCSRVDTFSDPREIIGVSDDVQPHTAREPSSCRIHSGQYGDQSRCRRSRNADDVHRIAHLAIERRVDASGDLVDMGRLRDQHPGSAGAVETDRNSGLTSNGTELGDRSTAPSCHGKCDSRMRKQSVAC